MEYGSKVTDPQIITNVLPQFQFRPKALIIGEICPAVMETDGLVSCPECYVPNQVTVENLPDSIRASLKKPGSGRFEEKTIECSNCNECYTVYLSEYRD